MIDLVLGLLSVVIAVLVGFYLVGHALPIRLASAIFTAGTAILAFLAYRWYESHVEYCRGSPEVERGGDQLSCLEPQHWFAFDLALLVLLIVELGLAILLASSLVRWKNQRRPNPSY